jgi:O-antigen/teichoic acid export membrane protein
MAISLKYRLLVALRWNVLGTIILQGSTFFSTVVVSNLLGRAVFGEYGIIQNTVMTFAGLAQLGISGTMTRFISEFRGKDPARTARILGLGWSFTIWSGVLGAVILLTCIRCLAEHALRAPHLASLLHLSVIGLIFTILSGFQVGALMGLESFAALSTAYIGSGLLSLPMFVALPWGWGLAGAVAALSFNALLRWLFLRYHLFRELQAHQLAIVSEGAWSEYRILLSYALPGALSSFSTLPALYFVNAFLARQPGGFSHLGMFNAVVTLRQALMFVPQVLNGVALPFLNNLRGNGERAAFWKTFHYLIAGTGVVMLLVGGLCYALGPLLMRFFGRDFQDGQPVLFWMIGAAIVEALAVGIAQIIQSLGRMWTSFLTLSIPRDLSLICLAWQFVPQWQAQGLGMAFFFSWLLCLGCVLILTAGHLRDDRALFPKSSIE